MRFDQTGPLSPAAADLILDFLYRIREGYATLRRYAPELLNVLGLRAAPAAKPVLNAIELLREMNAGNIRKLPDDAPVDFHPRTLGQTHLHRCRG